MAVASQFIANAAAPGDVLRIDLGTAYGTCITTTTVPDFWNVTGTTTGTWTTTNFVTQYYPVERVVAPLAPRRRRPPHEGNMNPLQALAGRLADRLASRGTRAQEQANRRAQEALEARYKRQRVIEDEQRRQHAIAERARQVERELLYAQQLRDAEVRRHAAVVAEERAERLLIQHLSEEQRGQYGRARWFAVQGRSGARYRVRYGSAGNIDVVGRSGCRTAAACGYPRNVPNGDVMLAQKLWLEQDDLRFLAHCMVTPYPGVEPILPPLDPPDAQPAPQQAPETWQIFGRVADQYGQLVGQGRVAIAGD